MEKNVFSKTPVHIYLSNELAQFYISWKKFAPKMNSILREKKAQKQLEERIKSITSL